MNDTPKTDAAAFRVDAGAPEVESSRMEEVVDADFARAQERRIAELEDRIRHRLAICNCGGHSKCGSCQDDEVALL